MTDLSTMSKEQLIAMLQAAQAQPARKITLKVTAKREDGKGTDGALSLYGLGRFPVTLYRSQWERLIAPDTVAQINAFIKANDTLLTVKA